MPKKQPASTATVEAPLSKQETKLALRCVRAIIGCGDLEANRRLQALSIEKRRKLATLESDGNRREAIPILY